MAIAVAQETCTPATGGMSGAGTTFAASSITLSAGSILVAVVTGVNATSLASISDSVNGTTGWVIAKQVTQSPLTLAICYRENMAAGAVTVTATYTASASQRGIKLLEITGGKTSGSQDGTPAGQFQTGVGTGADAITSGNTTNANQPALLVGACQNYGNNQNSAAGTGFTSTRVDWNTDVGGCRIEYKTLTTTTAVAATYTGPISDSWITLAAAFDEAPAGSVTAFQSSPEPPKRPQARAWVDSANPMPASKGSPWVFVEPPRIVPPRRQEAQSANPLPPLSAPAAVSFAPSGQHDRRPQAPRAAPVNPDPLPAARVSPWFQENAPPPQRAAARPRPEAAALPLPPFAGNGPPVETASPPARPPQRQRGESAAPLPSFVRLAPVVDPPPTRHVPLARRIINYVREAIGMPAVFIPVNTQVVKPPLVAKVDDLDLAVANVQLGNAASVDSIDMAIAGDT